MNELRDPEAVRNHFGEPSYMSKAKQMDHLDEHCKAFIELSPFVVLATTDAEGRADASPRGDKPGAVVSVIDDKTLVIPDRTGNKRTDTIMNIMANPHIGLLFMVPGINETLRVNGTVHVSIDAELLKPLTMEGKMPLAGFVVRAEEVFFHCGKPLIRSELWNPDKRVPRDKFPTLGQILADEIAGHKTAAEFDKGIEEQYRTRLY